jgi:hypothetical protein
MCFPVGNEELSSTVKEILQSSILDLTQKLTAEPPGVGGYETLVK